MNKRVKDCIKKSNKIKKVIEKLILLSETGKDCEKEIERFQLELEKFEEEIYAKTIFDIYSIKKPKLVRVSTKDIVDCEDAFGKDFSKLARSDKYALIGLFENGGKYKFK